MDFSLNLLAFGFVSPALLGWLALASVPVLIHWLYRRRYREVSWAAMQFLVEAARKQSRRTRMEQILLLAARVLILILMVLAFARPRWADANKLTSKPPPTLRVIVLDASLSMGRKSARDDASDSTLFEVAKSIARGIVSKSRSGDRFTLARIAGSEPRVLIRQPTLVSSAVLDEIERQPLTFERGDVVATMRHLSELIATKQPHERCEVVVISDFQADNWTVGQVASLPNLLDHQQAGSLPHEFVLIDVGAATPENAAVVGLSTDPPILAAEQPMSVAATLRNAGTVPLTARRIELRIDEQLIDSQRVDLSLGQDATVTFSLTAPASGEHALSVRLEEDSLPADNERWMPLTVRSELSVLLVNGRPSARPRDAATFFVEQALAPKTAKLTASSRWLRVNTIPDSELPNVELARHDVVFVCDVGTLTESDVDRLRRFAKNGGGVIVSLGPTVSVKTLNEFAFGSRGLLTVRLGELITSTSAENSPSVFGFDAGDFSHPLLREFRGNPGAGLETALIRQYLRVVADAASAEKQDNDAGSVGYDVALRFSTGDPAIVTQSLGRGRCVLVATSLDETWGEWAIWAAGFVPLIHELTEYAAAGSTQTREVLVGESIERDATTGAANIVLTAPDGVERTLTPVDRDGRSLVVMNDTLRPGNYLVTSSGASTMTERFAVNVDPRESNPRRIDPREWSAARSSEFAEGVVVRDANSPPPTPRDDLETESDSLTMELLAIVLVLLLVEQALAWRFTLGVVVAILSLAVAAAWFASRLL